MKTKEGLGERNTMKDDIVYLLNATLLSGSVVELVLDSYLMYWHGADSVKKITRHGCAISSVIILIASFSYLHVYMAELSM